MTRDFAIRSLRLIFALLTFFAIVTQFRIHTGLGFSVVNFFSYFTNLANLFAASVFMAGALRSTSAPSSTTLDLTRLLATANMVVVGVVFALLLRNVDLGSLRPWINVLLHYVMPVVVLLDWIVDSPRTRFRIPQLWPVLALPAAYLAYVLLRGGSTGWYPYPFLNPAIAGGAGGVAGYSVGIAVVVSLVTWVVLKARRTRDGG